jgi:hypothetical protein
MASNVEYLINKINGYQKNTVFAQPTLFQNAYQPNNQKIEIKLPQNAIIDLYSLCLTFDIQLLPNATGPNFAMRPPRYTSSLIRRLDVYVGGVQMGLSNLSDYGSIAALRKNYGIGSARMSEMCLYEWGGWNGTGSAGSDMAGGTNQYVGSGGPAWYRAHITDFLGVLGGDYMRYLDTNLLPDVTIQISLAPGTVFGNQSQATAAGSYELSSIKLYMELVKFGDGAYEKMVEARLSTGQPIVVPFVNWANFESSANLPSGDVVTNNSGSTASTQFVMATQSLNRLWGTFRVSDYDSQFRFAVTARSSNDSLFRGSTSGVEYDTYYFRFCAMQNDATHKVPRSYSPNFTAGAVSYPQPVSDPKLLTGPARYQFEVDSKLYPQFQADVSDCYALTKNALDRGGGRVDTTNSIIQDSLVMANQNFALVVSFQHNQPGSEDKLISGLNTQGSNLPIRWVGYNLGLPVNDGVSFYTTQIRPVVFAEFTSSMLVYAGRVVSVVN